MNLHQYLSVVSGVFGLFGGLFFAKGTLLLKSKEIKKITMALMDGPNPYFYKSLFSQKIDYLYGSFLLILSYGIQLGLPIFSDAPVNVKLFSIFVAMFLILIVISNHYCIKWYTRGTEDPLKELK